MAKRSRAEEVEMLLVKSKVRDYVKKMGNYNIGSDFIEALNQEVAGLIERATKRTAANNRKTLSARDV